MAAHEGLPVMYHWRALPDTTPLPEELADIDRAVAYWDGRPQVRHRIEAGDEAADRACAMVERELAAGIAFHSTMRARTNPARWVVASSWYRRRRGRAGSGRVVHHLRSVAGNDLTNVMTEIR